MENIRVQRRWRLVWGYNLQKSSSPLGCYENIIRGVGQYFTDEESFVQKCQGQCIQKHYTSHESYQSMTLSVHYHTHYRSYFFSWCRRIYIEKEIESWNLSRNTVAGSNGFIYHPNRYTCTSKFLGERSHLIINGIE